MANERLRTAGAPQALSGRVIFTACLGWDAQNKLSVKIATPRSVFRTTVLFADISFPQKVERKSYLINNALGGILVT